MTNMSSLLNAIYILLVLIVILFIVLITFIIKNETTVSMAQHAELFLMSMRDIGKFTEDDVLVHIGKFKYARSLFDIGLDDQNWENDIDLFLQTCLVATNILSFYADENSIYYRDHGIWKMLLFTHRMFNEKMKNNNETFYTSEDVYNIFTSFTIAMYICGRRDGNGGGGGELFDNVFDYAKFYNTRYHSDYTMKMTSSSSTNKDIFEHYKSRSSLCRKFNRQINFNKLLM